MSNKIVECGICQKRVVTRGRGKKFRHCGVDQPIDKALIQDLSTEKPNKAINKSSDEKQDIPKKTEKDQDNLIKNKDVKDGKETRKQEKTQEKPKDPEPEDKGGVDNTEEDSDGWGFD